MDAITGDSSAHRKKGPSKNWTEKEIEEERKIIDGIDKKMKIVDGIEDIKGIEEELDDNGIKEELKEKENDDDRDIIK